VTPDEPGAGRAARAPAAGAPAARDVAYDYAVLRVVPHPHLGPAAACVPVGVVVQARTREFLDLAVVTDAAWLAARAPSADAELLARYLDACRRVCRGDPAAAAAGHAVALAPPSERFHWVTAPRSDVLQCAPAHGGLCADPAAELARLFAEYVGAVSPGG
jgi:hypothetical protein